MALLARVLKALAAAAALALYVWYAAVRSLPLVRRRKALRRAGRRAP